jgi:tRNA-2-methylthio-N6-dimethylallyladenosine synthase
LLLIGLGGVFGFKYSERPGTPAVRIGDDVPEVEKEARLAELFDVAGRLRERHLEGLVGSPARVLVEGRGKGRAFTGRTERNEIVHFDAHRDVTGEVVDVVVRRAFKNSLEAEPVDADLRIATPREARAERRSLPVVPCR